MLLSLIQFNSRAGGDQGKPNGTRGCPDEIAVLLALYPRLLVFDYDCMPLHTEPLCAVYTHHAESDSRPEHLKHCHVLLGIFRLNITSRGVVVCEASLRSMNGF
jgi:hypothetical protein